MTPRAIVEVSFEAILLETQRMLPPGFSVLGFEATGTHLRLKITHPDLPPVLECEPCPVLSAESLDALVASHS